MHPARIGGHRTMLRTIDFTYARHCRQEAWPRVGAAEHNRCWPAFGACIAGCAYAAFLAPAAFEGARVGRFAPSALDPSDYLRFALRDGTFATVTPTCAANLLGYAGAASFASGNVAAA